MSAGELAAVQAEAEALRRYAARRAPRGRQQAAPPDPMRPRWHAAFHEAGRRSAMYDIIDVANAAAARPGAEWGGVLGEVLALACLVVQMDQPEDTWRIGGAPC